MPADALQVIDYLNTHPNGTLPPTYPAGSYYLDVTGTGEIIPLDALEIVNYLNTHAAPGPTVAPAVTNLLPAPTELPAQRPFKSAT